jgi:hypothetical protein
VFFRVPHGSGWSPWLEVGYWKANLWPGEKTTAFEGGWINIDTVVLYSYVTEWQFKVEMKRLTATVASPALSLLSFFASDERTTLDADIPAILADRPEGILIPTTFLAQYRISDEYGGRICSPTTVSMILLSYDIDVDPLAFALDTYDPYWEIFGVWPRVVQNASEFGLEGTVTRYRSWGEAREVLAAGGRIGMSIGRPLYRGHLVMLAGFTDSGDPIVHDPARTSDGYAHVFDKEDLSRSWFDKGGVAYTFFLPDTTQTAVVVAAEHHDQQAPVTFELYPSYPNPLNLAAGTMGTTIRFFVTEPTTMKIVVFDTRGREVATLVDDQRSEGFHSVQWCPNARAVSSGVYFIRAQAGSVTAICRCLVIK